MFMHYKPLLADDKPGDPTGNDPAKNGNGTADDKKTFSQAELDALFAERAKRAATQATADLLTTLGVKDGEELKAKLAKAKELEEAQLSELQKAQKAAADATALVEKANQEKATALALAQRRLMQSAVLAEAVKQKFDEAEINSVWMAIANDPALADLIKVNGDAFEGVDKAVEKIAKQHPRWLQATTRPPSGTPPRAQANGRGGDNRKEIGPQLKHGF